MDVATFFFTGLVFVVAGTVKGITGLGLPTLSIGLLGLLMSPAEAASLMVLPTLATNVAQCTGPHWKRVVAACWSMWLAIAVLTTFSPLPDLSSSSSSIQFMLGGLLLAYGAFGISRIGLPNLRRVCLLVGAASGAISGILIASTGIFVVPMVPFLQALHFDKDEMIQALGISFTLAAIFLAVRLALHGRYGIGFLGWPTAVPVVGAFLGMRIGALVRNKLNPRNFQDALYVVLMVLGIMMLAKK